MFRCLGQGLRERFLETLQVSLVWDPVPLMSVTMSSGYLPLRAIVDDDQSCLRSAT
jgi:hypothetical protein